MDDFSWTHQKTEVTGQRATLKSGDTGEYRDHSQDLDPWSRSCWGHKLAGMLQGRMEFSHVPPHTAIKQRLVGKEKGFY